MIENRVKRRPMCLLLSTFDFLNTRDEGKSRKRLLKVEILGLAFFAKHDREDLAARPCNFECINTGYAEHKIVARGLQSPCDSTLQEKPVPEDRVYLFCCCLCVCVG